MLYYITLQDVRCVIFAKRKLLDGTLDKILDPYKGINYLSTKLGFVYFKQVTSNEANRFNCTDWGRVDIIDSNLTKCLSYNS